ncbi:aminotransferase class IV [Hymenobacter sp. 5516J-16]|uniref:Aminotransferase class IV n=1 Tax=Hymenobacter sublimis TaxID=2933777 RepID=A0ABY4JDX2_9BACT|nr:MULTISPECIES: aminotransferase class IV [Hymenobacter]UOQ77320.1 aminotransferase class IV [Hymenobacter sp. 5516J-16]UPL50998.1 aminotransferase class IV [Hymenobacter sublimis]
MLLYNGQLVTESDVALSLPNRGLYYNDGFFETMVRDQAGIRYLPHHLARMQRAAQALGLALPPELQPDHLAVTLGQLVAANAEHATAGPQRIRLQVWRAGAGLYTPTTTACQWLATTQDFAPQDAPVDQAGFSARIFSSYSPFSFCKGPNALTYVQAARERDQRGLGELVLRSADGYVAETVAAGIGWIKEGTVYTPTEATGAVAGTRLAYLRTVAHRLGVVWQTGRFLPAEVLAAEAVFTANVAGIRLIRRLETVSFGAAEHPLLQRLRAAE